MLVGQLWTAPELIRQKSDAPVYGTQPGDVYSFGIILSEIVTRALPFEKNDIQYNVAGILIMFLKRLVLDLN